MAAETVAFVGARPEQLDDRPRDRPRVVDVDTPADSVLLDEFAMGGALGDDHRHGRLQILEQLVREVEPLVQGPRWLADEPDVRVDGVLLELGGRDRVDDDDATGQPNGLLVEPRPQPSVADEHRHDIRAGESGSLDRRHQLLDPAVDTEAALVEDQGPVRRDPDERPEATGPRRQLLARSPGRRAVQYDRRPPDTEQ